MVIRGTSDPTDGTYTVAVTAKPRWLRRFVLWLFTHSYKDEIVFRADVADTAHVILKR